MITPIPLKAYNLEEDRVSQKQNSYFDRMRFS